MAARESTVDNVVLELTGNLNPYAAKEAVLTARIVGPISTNGIGDYAASQTRELEAREIAENDGSEEDEE